MRSLKDIDFGEVEKMRKEELVMFYYENIANFKNEVNDLSHRYDMAHLDEGNLSSSIYKEKQRKIGKLKRLENRFNELKDLIPSVKENIDCLNYSLNGLKQKKLKKGVEIIE